MLRWRLFSAAIILTVLISLIAVDYQLGDPSSLGRSGIILAPLAILLSGLAARELLFLLQSHQPNLPIAGIVACSMGVMAASCAPVIWREYPVDCPVGKLGWGLYGTIFAFGGIIFLEMRRFTGPNQATVRIGLGMITVLYCGTLPGFLAALRFHESNATGLIALISVISAVKVADTGAYAFGRLWGKTKIAPILSPKKTVAGTVGGLLIGSTGTWLALIILFSIFRPGQPFPIWWQALLYGLVISLVGMFGDLAESLLKRDANQKDSSKWLPGLGGVLDVIDSLLAAAPVAAIFWSMGWIELP